ncbi:MATE family efflux transporter [Emcibacter sp. SYSU 3D8]|uniref:MATE family efflux transporter n=1 Tax=Emcibacter sp. SYSU 3D8 TaxID=3133969 RepID=UPI0031FF15A8
MNAPDTRLLSQRTDSAYEGPILKALLTLAVPIVAGNMLQSAYQLLDAFWVGRLGAAAVAAVNITFPMTFLMFALGAGFSIAGSTFIAQYVGARNQAMVNRVAAQTMLLVACISLMLGMIGYSVAPIYLRAMGIADDVFPGALSYMRFAFISLIFGFSFAVFQAVMRGVGEAKLPMYVILGTVVLNGFLSPLLIFGWGPIPGHGVTGAAMSGLFTQGVAATIALLVLFGGRYGIHVSWSDFKPDMTYMKRAFLLGFPSSIEMSTRAAGVIMLSFLVASFGTRTIAAYGVGTTIFQVVIIPAMGLAMAISVLVGQNIGAHNPQRAAQIARTGATLGFGALTLLGIVAFIFAPDIIRVFIPGDPGVIQDGSRFVRIQCLIWGFVGLQFCLVGVLRAAGNMMATMIIGLVSQWVLMFPVAYMLSKHTSLGAEGIWWAFPIANVAITTITLIWYWKGDWRYVRLTDDEQAIVAVNEAAAVEERRH